MSEPHGYYLFAGSSTNSMGGWHDLRGHYRTMDDALAHAYAHTFTADGWLQIVDVKELEIVKVWAADGDAGYYGDRALPQDRRDWNVGEPVGIYY